MKSKEKGLGVAEGRERERESERSITSASGLGHGKGEGEGVWGGGRWAPRPGRCMRAERRRHDRLGLHSKAAEVIFCLFQVELWRNQHREGKSEYFFHIW